MSGNCCKSRHYTSNRIAQVLLTSRIDDVQEKAQAGRERIPEPFKSANAV